MGWNDGLDWRNRREGERMRVGLTETIQEDAETGRVETEQRKIEAKQRAIVRNESPMRGKRRKRRATVGNRPQIESDRLISP